MSLQLRQQIVHLSIFFQKPKPCHVHQGISRGGHLGDGSQIVHGIRGCGMCSVQGSDGVVHDDLACMGDHDPCTRHGALGQGVLQQAVDLRMGFFPKRQAPIHGTSQSHGALQVQAVPLSPGRVHRGDGKFAADGGDASHGVGHGVAGAFVVLVSHQDSGNMGLERHEFGQGIRVAHPHHHDVPGVEVAFFKQGGHPSQPVRLNAKVSRGPVAHLGGGDQHMGGLRKGRLDVAFAQATSVFSDHMP